MSKKSPRVIVKEAAGVDLGPFRAVSVSACAPNTWNPNKMTPFVREKLENGIKLLRDRGAEVPPIIVRPHPDKTVAEYQIIDGFHRWDIYRQSDIQNINAFVVDVDTRTAMILTDTLNYLRGSPDSDLHAKFFQALNEEHQMPVTEIAEFVPQTPSEIEAIFDTYSISPFTVEADGNGGAPPTEEERDDDTWVELKFNVTVGQLRVIEDELRRISKHITGKNLRGRALEYMAVTSSQTDIDNLTGEPPEVQDDEDAPRANLKRLKAKLRAVATASPKTKTKKVAS